MALDEVLGESVRVGGLPVLRFYTWSPGCLSLGRFQNLQDGLTDEARRAPMVRRPTGGGGIWHDDELTYSLACRPDDLGVTGVKPSFELLCSFLLDTWRDLGWTAGFAKDGGGSGLGAFTPACFAGQEEYDIVVGGRKLGGNAQRRDRGLVFQHGSIPRRLDHPRLAQLFAPDDRPDPASVTDLETCGWKGPLDDLIPRLADRFSKNLGAVWEESGSTAEEIRRAQELVDRKYGAEGWTRDGEGALRPTVGS